MYWRGEGTTKTDTDGSWQQFVLSLEQRRKREERRTSFRRGVAEVRSGLRFGETEEALKFRWGNKGALLTDFLFFFLRVQMLRYARLCKSNRYFTAGQLLGEASGSKQHINSTDGPIMKVLCSPYCSCAVALAPFNGQLPGVNVCNCESQLRN